MEIKSNENKLLGLVFYIYFLVATREGDTGGCWLTVQRHQHSTELSRAARCCSQAWRPSSPELCFGLPKGRQVSRGRQAVPGDSDTALPFCSHYGFLPNINNALDSRSLGHCKSIWYFPLRCLYFNCK